MSLDKYESSISNESLADISNNLKCEICNHIFTTRYNLKRHIKTFHEVERSDTDDASGTDVADENISEVKSSEDEPMSEGEVSSDDIVTSDDDDNDNDDNEEEEDKDSSDDDDVHSQNHVTNIFLKLFIDIYFEHNDQLESLREKLLDKNISKKEAVVKAIFACDAAKMTFHC